MTSKELKHIIVEHLNEIDDVSFLEAIRTILESKAHIKVYELSDQQKKRVKEGREQYEKGQITTQKEVEQEVKRWLNTK